MGKKSWFSAVRKVISTSYLKEKKHKKLNKSKSTKKTRHGNQMSLDTSLSPTNAPIASLLINLPPIDEPEFKQPENEPMKQDSTAISMEEESATTTSQVNCVTSAPRFLGKPEEHIAAIKIQKAYRGYLVRNDSNPLKAWRRLKMYMQTHAVKRRVESTLMSMQTASRVQSQVRTRKIRMADVNDALQQQQLQKRLNKLKTTKSSEKSGWDLSPKSKEQVEASLQRRKEALERREKVLAYTYTRQQTWRKNLQKSASQDSNHADWEWNWAAKWDAVRPWETGTYRDAVAVKTNRVSRQSAPSKVAAKSTNTYCPMSISGPSSLGSEKKRALSTGAGLVGSAKKRVAVSGSPSLGVKRSAGSSKMITNTRR